MTTIPSFSIGCPIIPSKGNIGHGNHISTRVEETSEDWRRERWSNILSAKS